VAKGNFLHAPRYFSFRYYHGSANFFLLQSIKTTVEHIWTIDNVRLCFAEDGDEQRSSVFPIGGMNCRILLKRYTSGYFGHFWFRLEPVNETADKTKTFEQQRGEFKLSFQNGNKKGT
jgi:hypothetical protein